MEKEKNVENATPKHHEMVKRLVVTECRQCRENEQLTRASGCIPAHLLNQTPAKQGAQSMHVHVLLVVGQAGHLSAAFPPAWYLLGLSVWYRATQATVAGLQAQ